MTTRNPVFPSFLLLLCLASHSPSAASQSDTLQHGDRQWSPTVARPEFPQGDGPIVFVDAAHGNFHTINGRFAAFAELLKADGYRVQSAEGPVTRNLLGEADVFVISNAVDGGVDAEWVLPTPSAFTTEEIEALAAWVEEGGSLLLIADHMPFPGAAADLANRFGIVFYNGYALRGLRQSGTLVFTRGTGALADHAITRGRSDSEAIGSVKSFTGQAFRSVTGVQPLMYMPENWKVLFPSEAGAFDEGTPLVSTRGLIQSCVLRFGAGRVAVFGEAAMFTAQTWVQDGVVGRMGLNDPEAGENAQFVLNLMHWLSGLLDEQS